MPSVCRSACFAAFETWVMNRIRSSLRWLAVPIRVKWIGIRQSLRRPARQGFLSMMTAIWSSPRRCRGNHKPLIMLNEPNAVPLEVRMALEEFNHDNLRMRYAMLFIILGVLAAAAQAQSPSATL